MFTPYEKIEEDLSGRQLTTAQYRQFARVPWVVTEKIHGANFCILLDANGFTYAKRKEILSPEEDFFQYQTLVSELEEKSLRLQELVTAHSNQPPETLLVYGELFGGGYPHPDVEPVPTVDLVQSGVYYAPDVRFCVFDIAVYTASSSRKNYLDYEQVCAWCEEVGMLYAKPLLTGTYEQAVAYDIRFGSTLPAVLGLPPLPFPNLAEGVVIKPWENLELETEKGVFRPVVKRKIAEFAETQFHQAEKWQPFEPKGKATRLTRTLLGLVTMNRLQNAVSKVGKVQAHDARNLAQLQTYFWEDIAEEMQMYATDFQKLTQAEQTRVQRHLKEAAEKLIHEFVS